MANKDKMVARFLIEESRLVDAIKLMASMGGTLIGASLHEARDKPPPGTGAHAPENSSDPYARILSFVASKGGEPVSRADIILDYIGAGGSIGSVDPGLTKLKRENKIAKRDRGLYAWVRPQAVVGDNEPRPVAFIENHREAGNG